MARHSVSRQALLWLMEPPRSNHYVTCNLEVDFTTAREYLKQLNQEEPRVTVQHLISAAIAQVYREFPRANATVRGRRIEVFPHVGIGMPVDLLSSGNTPSRELSAALLEKAETLSLRELAEKTQGRVRQEKTGQGSSLLTRFLLPLAEQTPPVLLQSGLNLAERLLSWRPLSQIAHRMLPVTVGVSNVGSIVQLPDGAVFRGASMSPPNRLFSLGSFLGVAPIQEQPRVSNGKVEVRPMLPLVYVFDHRLFDGVYASKILSRLSVFLLEPASQFGENGARKFAEAV